MAKVALRKADTASKKTGPVKGTARAEVSCDRVLALASKLRKMCDSDPEYVRLRVTDEVSLSGEASGGGGTVTLYDREALVAESTEDVDVRLPMEVLRKTLAGRGKVTVEVKGNMLLLRSGSKYKADLHFEVPDSVPDFKPIKGQDATPLSRMLAEVAPLLALRESVSTTREDIDVHFEWDHTGITAAVSDEYHGVIVEGPASSKTRHRVTLPLRLARKLGEIGGQFDIGDTRIQAESDVGHVDLAQVSARDSIIPYESIVSLLKEPSSWEGELMSDDLATLMANTSGTEDGRNEVVFDIDERVIMVRSSSAFGTVEGTVDVTTVKGDPPGALTVRPSVFDVISLKMRGPIRMSRLKNKNIIRLEPQKQGEWNVYGFVLLLGGDAQPSR